MGNDFSFCSSVPLTWMTTKMLPNAKNCWFLPCIQCRPKFKISTARCPVPILLRISELKLRSKSECHTTSRWDWGKKGVYEKKWVNWIVWKALISLLQSLVEFALEELKEGMEEENQSGEILSETRTRLLLDPVVEKILIAVLRTLPNRQVRKSRIRILWPSISMNWKGGGASPRQFLKIGSQKEVGERRRMSICLSSIFTIGGLLREREAIETWSERKREREKEKEKERKRKRKKHYDFNFRFWPNVWKRLSLTGKLWQMTNCCVLHREESFLKFCQSMRTTFSCQGEWRMKANKWTTRFEAMKWLIIFSRVSNCDHPSLLFPFRWSLKCERLRAARKKTKSPMKGGNIENCVFPLIYCAPMMIIIVTIKIGKWKKSIDFIQDKK